MTTLINVSPGVAVNPKHIEEVYYQYIDFANSVEWVVNIRMESGKVWRWKYTSYRKRDDAIEAAERVISIINSKLYEDIWGH